MCFEHILMSIGLRLYVEQTTLKGHELQLLNIRFKMHKCHPYP